MIVRGIVVFLCSVGINLAWATEEDDPNSVHPTYQIAYPGSHVHIVCNSTDRQVKFMKNGQILPSQQTFIITYTKAYLAIAMAEESDEGEYFCVGNNFVIKSEVYLARIDVKPGVVIPQYQRAKVGEIVTFTCKYDNDVKWFSQVSVYLPTSRPVHYGKQWSFQVSSDQHKFIFCHGVTPSGKYLARSFLEIIKDTEGIPGEIVSYYKGEEEKRQDEKTAIKLDDPTMMFQKLDQENEECPRVTLEDGIVKTSGYQSGNEILFMCNRGSQLVGPAKGICKNGHWGEIPYCISGEIKFRLSHTFYYIVGIIFLFSVKLDRLFY